MAGRRRLGVVLLVPPPFDREIDGMRRALGDRALARIPAHLTLVPPVNVRDDEMSRALDVLRGAASRARPLKLTLGPPATFMPTNPVLYLAVAGQTKELRALRDGVFRPPLERELSWEFIPHVTLADEADPATIDAAMYALASYRDVEVTFDRVHILEEGDRRVWRPIADARLAAPAVVGRGGLELELTTTAALDSEAETWTERAWDSYSRSEYGDDVATDAPFAVTARRDGAIVGTATGAVRGSQAYLARLVVEESERRVGVGSHLLKATESLAAEAGAEILTLRTLADGPARAFYEARGWVVDRELPAWRNGRDFVRMIRPL